MVTPVCSDIIKLPHLPEAKQHKNVLVFPLTHLVTLCLPSNTNVSLFKKWERKEIPSSRKVVMGSDLLVAHKLTVSLWTLPLNPTDVTHFPNASLVQVFELPWKMAFPSSACQVMRMRWSRLAGEGSAQDRRLIWIQEHGAPSGNACGDGGLDADASRKEPGHLATAVVACPTSWGTCAVNLCPAAAGPPSVSEG